MASCTKSLDKLTSTCAGMQVLKIQPQTFKSSYIKLIALLWSLVFSAIFSINFEIGIHVRETLKQEFIAILVFFVFFGVVFFITAIVYIVFRNMTRVCEYFRVSWLVDIAYLIGGLTYYVGRNLPQVALTHDQCERTCQESILLAQPILLGMVVVIYRFIPFFISKYYQSNLAKEHQTTEAKLQLVPEWILAAESLTLLVEFDALFTIMTYYVTDCAIYQVGFWVLWGLFVLTYMFILYYTMNIQYCGNCNANASCVASNFGTIVPLAGFGLYLVTNNVPIFQCTGANAPIAWLVIKILVLIVVITVIVLLMVYRCMSKTQQEKLLPRTLQYVQLPPNYDEQNEPPRNINTY